MAAPPLPPPVPGERVDIDSPSGRLCAWVSGSGAPLLLVHSVNAAASAAEVRPLVERLAGERTLWALELPGFGHSERSDRAYTPRVMTRAVLAAAEAIQARSGPAPVDALAVSLGCEFLARAAVEQPARFGRLALVSPTGLAGGRPMRGPAGTTRGSRWLYGALRGPGGLWGLPLFEALTRPGVIRYFLRRTWGSRDIDEALWRHDVLTARQPGAEFAPLAFVAGWLFAADALSVYEALGQPVWMSHGTRGDFTDYRGAEALRARPNWRLSVYAAGAMPYFEQPEAFCRELLGFLKGVSA